MSITRACPECLRRVEHDAKICVGCGFDFRTERRVARRAFAMLRALRAYGRVAIWTVGLGAAGVVVGLFVASITGHALGRFHLPVALAYLAVGTVVGIVSDFQRHGPVAAIMWLAPFTKSSLLTGIALTHEYSGRRWADRSPVRQAIYANALLAGLTLLAFGVVLLVGLLNP